MAPCSLVSNPELSGGGYSDLVAIPSCGAKLTLYMSGHPRQLSCHQASPLGDGRRQGRPRGSRHGSSTGILASRPQLWAVLERVGCRGAYSH